MTLAASMSLTARADSLSTDSWTYFEWDANGTVSHAFDFVATGPTWINVTDGFFAGDAFSVSANGVPLGTTNVVTASSEVGCTDPSVCFVDSDFSHGSWFVLPGVYNITISVTDHPWGDGGAWVEASSTSPTPTPEPGTIALLGSGLLALAGVMRRKMSL
jgi:hypothetical protein